MNLASVALLASLSTSAPAEVPDNNPNPFALDSSTVVSSTNNFKELAGGAVDGVISCYSNMSSSGGVKRIEYYPGNNKFSFTMISGDLNHTKYTFVNTSESLEFPLNNLLNNPDLAELINKTMESISCVYIEDIA